MGEARRPSEDRLSGESEEPAIAEERSASRGADEANQRAGSAAVRRVAGEAECTVRLPVDEEHAAGPAGETQIQLDNGKDTVSCPGVYDTRTKSLYVRLAAEQVRTMFPSRSAEPTRLKRGIALGDGVSLSGGGLTIQPDQATRVTVRPKAGGWRVTIGHSF